MINFPVPTTIEYTKHADARKLLNSKRYLSLYLSQLVTQFWYSKGAEYEKIKELIFLTSSDIRVTNLSHRK